MRYGSVLQCDKAADAVSALWKLSCPNDRVIYEASVDALEKLDLYYELRARIFGEMPIQFGHCSGMNQTMDALEYHRTSEVNVMATDAILILGRKEDITPDWIYDTKQAEVFYVPAGSVIELYANTLHYAPCSVNFNPFRAGIILPRGTNLRLNEHHEREQLCEDRLIAATNKWLLGHPEADLPDDVYKGIIGENLRVD